MTIGVTKGLGLARLRRMPGSGGAAAGQNFEIAYRCPVTEISVFYKFLHGVQRVVAAFPETLLSLSLFHRFRIPPDNFYFCHDSFPRTSTGMRSSISIGRHFQSNKSAIPSYINTKVSLRFLLRWIIFLPRW